MSGPMFLPVREGIWSQVGVWYPLRPQVLTSSGNHFSGRYTSCWNAFLFVLSPDGSPDGIPGLQIVSVRSLAGSEHDVPPGGREEQMVMDKYVEKVWHECKACGKI